MKSNPTYVLNEDQTEIFRTLWTTHRSELKPTDFNFVWLKLNRKRAVLTKNQVFRIVMTLTETGFCDPLPEWLLQLIDPTGDQK